MSAVIVVGWIGIAFAVIVMIAGLNTLLGELNFRARWKWGDAHKLKRSVRLGWNTGTPPDGSLFLVMEYKKQLAKNPDYFSEHRDAVMRRRGDRFISASGGYSGPITNISGWLEVVDESAKPATPEASPSAGEQE